MNIKRVLLVVLCFCVFWLVLAQFSPRCPCVWDPSPMLSDTWDRTGLSHQDGTRNPVPCPFRMTKARLQENI